MVKSQKMVQMSVTVDMYRNVWTNVEFGEDLRPASYVPSIVT